jgi:hypothetical protein
MKNYVVGAGQRVSVLRRVFHQNTAENNSIFAVRRWSRGEFPRALDIFDND